MIMEWMITKGNLHNFHVSHDIIDSVRYFPYILADSAYNASDIYDYVSENIHALPIIDTNKRGGIIPHRLLANSKIGSDLRKEYASLYSLRLEIERTSGMFEEIMKAEKIWYTAIGLKTMAYNLMII